MRPEHRARWESEIRQLGGRLKTPRDLVLRAISPDDFIDSAVIGGVSVADVVHGKIAESQITRDVIDAFHTQYPQYGKSFVNAVNQFSADPAQLMGLINGVKGKLFEIDYLAWLNDGHLQAGYTAELAQHANNPAWDIVISDAQGHINELLQLKATESVDYVRQAIAVHPDIDVVVPHELYERIATHSDLVAHIIDSHEQIAGMNERLAEATSHAEAAGIHFQLPVIAIGFAVSQNFVRYRQRKVTFQGAIADVGERSLLAMVATGAGWAVSLLAHKSIVGAPMSFVARLLGSQALHNRSRRETLDLSLKRANDSIRQISAQSQRLVVESPTTAG